LRVEALGFIVQGWDWGDNRVAELIEEEVGSALELHARRAICLCTVWGGLRVLGVGFRV